MYYSLTRATVWNLSGYLYLILASFISTPILIHALTLPVFAQYGLIIASITLVSSIDLGLPRAVVRALVQSHDNFAKRQKIWATSSLLFASTGLVAGAVAVALTLSLHLTPLTYLLIFSIALLNNITAHYQTLTQAEGHFGYYNSKTFIVGTANTLLAAYLAQIGYGITTIITSQLFCYLLSLLPFVYFSLKFFPHPREGKATLSVVRTLLQFGLKNQVGKIVGQIEAQYGKYLLAPLAPLYLSSYMIASNLVQKIAGGVGQLAAALYPATARSNIRALYYRLQLLLFLGGLAGAGLYYWLGLSFLTWWLHSPELVTLVDRALRIFMPYFVVLVLTPLPSTILDGSGRPELTSLFAFITTATEIALALLLLPSQGFLAPVYSALAAVIITTPFLLYTTHQVLNKVKSNS